jgi:hypothetical protein
MSKEDVPEVLEQIQRKSFDYFLEEYNPDNGLVADTTGPNSPSSIAAAGFALSCYPIGVYEGWLEREDAAERTVQALRFFWRSKQSRAADATGYKGFFYHFLDMKTGRRFRQSELSTIDTALLLGGMLIARAYFDDADDPVEREIDELVNKVYERVDWNWARNGGATVTMGWQPEHGFLRARWQGYDESLLLYLLALASPSHPIPPESYLASVAEYHWTEAYGYDYLYAGPLFTHQYPHVWIDFRGIQDEFMREHDSTYFENSRRATYIQREYAIDNPRGFKEYGPYFWGITASDGPGPVLVEVDGKEQRYFGYVGRGVPYGPDDGTIAPWVVATSLPFAPEIVLPTLGHFNEMNLHSAGNDDYGYQATVNPTFPRDEGDDPWWTSDVHYGINQGPLILMVQNYQTNFFWNLTKKCGEIYSGLQAAGFRGGWLEDNPAEES